MDVEVNDGWRFLKLEDDGNVDKFRAKADRQHRSDGSPGGCAAYLRKERGGSRLVFMNRAASEVAAKIPIFGPMLRSLHPSLVRRTIAGAQRMDLFDR